MNVQFNPGERLWNGAVAGVGVLGTATSAIVKTFLRSGFGAYFAGRKVITDAMGSVEGIVTEAKAEIRAEKVRVRQKRRAKEASRPREVEEQAVAHEKLKPGAPAPATGRYREVGPRGGKGPEITSRKGEPLPTTTKKGSTYTLVEADDDE